MMCGEQRSAAVTLMVGMALLITCVGGVAETPSGEKTPLPKPKPKGKVSLEEALWKRQSVRSFTDRVPTWEQVGQLLWAAQGINRPGTKFRTAPSAGALYPLELYVLLPSGIYRYLPEEHAVVKTGSQDMRNALSEAGLRQGFIQEATCVFVICAVFERTAAKYGNEATRYVLLEGGHAAQNLLLQAVAMGMAGVPIGAMISEEAQKVLRVPQEQRPIYILATGFPK